MTADVIFLSDRKKSAPSNLWRFSMDVFEGPEALISNFDDGDGMDAGDRLRLFSEYLEGLAFMMRQQAEQISESADGSVLAQAFIHESSRVRVRVNDTKFITEEQRVWLDERWSDASGMARQAPVSK